MPDGVSSIVVSSGIAAVAPFTTGTIPVIAGTAPDVLSDSIMRQVPAVAPTAVVIGATDPDPADAAVLRMVGAIYPRGEVEDSVVVGRGVNVTAGANALQVAVGVESVISGGEGSIAIGFGLTIGGTGNNIIIGRNHDALSGDDNGNVLIGQLATLTDPGFTTGSVGIGLSVAVGFEAVALGDRAIASGFNSICIGNETPQATGDNAIALGTTAIATANLAMAIGAGATAIASGSICIGRFANTAAMDTNSIALGLEATTFGAAQCVVGGPFGGQITTLVIGAGNETAAPIAGVTVRTTNLTTGGAADVAGVNITVATGLGKGNAIGGRFIVSVPAIGVSGSAQQTAVTGLEVQPSTTALDTYLLIRDVDNATLERVSVGAADSGGAGFKLLRIPN